MVGIHTLESGRVYGRTERVVDLCGLQAVLGFLSTSPIPGRRYRLLAGVLLYGVLLNQV